MAYKVFDNVIETSTSSGTGNFTLSGALTGSRSFGGVLSVSDLCPYGIWAVDGNGARTGDFEVGIGTYSSANTLTRTLVIASSNSNAAVSFAAVVTKYVAIVPIASLTPQLNNETAIVLPKATVVSVTTPAADTLAFFARLFAGRMIPSWKDPSGVAYRTQPAIWGEKILQYKPNTGSTIGVALGAPWTSGGTLSHPTPSLTSPAVTNQIVRTRWANVVTTTNQTLGLVQAGLRYCRGNANTGSNRCGGFFFNCRFIVELWPAATVRLFVGLTDQAAGTSPVASDTLAGNCIGLWHDTTDAATVLSIVTRNGTTTTKTSVGTLPQSLQAMTAYDFTMYCKPNDSHVYVRLEEVNSDTVICENLDITATLPTNTALMGIIAQMSNGTANTTATTTAIGVSELYAASTY